jgi:thiosulfate/3-mercaptopyruvate sulfurtransferase
MTRFLPIFFSVLIVIGIAGAFPAQAPKADPQTAARLVSFDGLEKELTNPELRLLDVRPKADYEKDHIPGAVWADVKAAAKIASRPDGLKDTSAWEAWIAPLAISNDSEVLVYDGDRQLEAARTWWLLGYLGVPNVGLINGNYPLWVKEGRATTKDVPRLEPKPFAVRFSAVRHATREQVLDSLKHGSVHIIDARSEAEHTGAEAKSKRAGRIPSACHIEWSTLVDKDGRFVDDGALRARLAKLGVKRGEPVITHCQGGGRASVDAFALERIGHPARNYYHGWSDWGNVEETPVETGKPKEKP